MGDALPREDYADLDGIAAKIVVDGLVKDHWQRLRKYALSVRSSKIVSWLLSQGIVKTEDDAVVMGQRMVDADVIRPCVPADVHSPFANKHIVYNMTKDVDTALTTLSSGQRFQLKMNAQITQGAFDIQGVCTVGSAHAVLLVEEKKLQIFRGNDLLVMRNCLSLENATFYFTEERPQNAVRPAAFVNNPQQRALSDAALLRGSAPKHTHEHTNVANAGVAAVDGENPEKDTDYVPPPFCVLVLMVPNMRALRIRMNSKQERTKWEKAFEGLVKMVNAEEAQAADLTAESVLDLRDVMETPSFRAHFCEFLKKSFALENLKFLEAVDAYRLINDYNERKEVAVKIHTMFIDPSAPELVNLDGNTFAAVNQRIQQQQYRKNMFDEAYNVVHKMLARDAYMRFVRTPEYKQMISASNDHRLSRGSSSDGLRLSPSHRRNSVSGSTAKSQGSSSGPEAPDAFVIPSMDDKKTLVKIATDLRKSGMLKSERVFLKKYDNCASGSDVVQFLLSKDHANIRPVAQAMGQRMMDLGILFHVKGTDVTVFADSSAELYTLDEPEELKTALSVEELRKQLSTRAGEDVWLESPMLIKGVKYNKVHVLYDGRDRKLHVYRQAQGGVKPLKVLSLKRLQVKIHRIEEKTDASLVGSSGLGGPTGALTHIMYYMHVGDVLFRLESEEDFNQWSVLVGQSDQSVQRSMTVA